MDEIFDESHYFVCSQGLKPAAMKKNQEIVKREDGKYYLTQFSLKCYSIDFSCKWVALLCAIIAAAVALLLSNPAGWVLLAAIVGAAAGAAIGSALCGDMASIMRVWVAIKTDAQFGEHNAVANRPGSHMTCAAFGGQITYVPNVTAEWQANLMFGINIGMTGLEGFMYVYATKGVGTLLTKPAQFFANFGVNYLKTLTVGGVAGRTAFGVVGGTNAYFNSPTEGFHAGEVFSEAGRSFTFAETAAYNAVVNHDAKSAALLISMGGIPGGLSNKDATGMADVRAEARATADGWKTAGEKAAKQISRTVEAAKEFRERLKSQKKGTGANEKGHTFDFSKFKMKAGEKLGVFGEGVVKAMLESKGYDEFYEVQNKSGNGVDIVARNSKTGEVMKAEVKSTQQERLWDNGNMKEISLKGDQKKMGGEKYTTDRLNRAVNEEDGYTDGVSSDQAKAAQKEIQKAEFEGKPINHEKYDIYVDQNGNLLADPQPRGWLPNP